MGKRWDTSHEIPANGLHNQRRVLHVSAGRTTRNIEIETPRKSGILFLQGNAPTHRAHEIPRKIRNFVFELVNAPLYTLDFTPSHYRRFPTTVETSQENEISLEFGSDCCYRTLIEGPAFRVLFYRA